MEPVPAMKCAQTNLSSTLRCYTSSKFHVPKDFSAPTSSRRNTHYVRTILYSGENINSRTTTRDFQDFQVPGIVRHPKYYVSQGYSDQLAKKRSLPPSSLDYTHFMGISIKSVLQPSHPSKQATRINQHT